MAFKTCDQILEADPRFTDLRVLNSAGLRRLSLADHHAAIATISLKGAAPQPIQDAFDRARNILLYSWFDYDLLVVGENQAFSAFEFALKLRLELTGSFARGGLGNRIDRARKVGILPATVSAVGGLMDPIETLRYMRNSLAHGTTDIHTPAMTFDVAALCADAIDIVFPKPSAVP